MATGAATTSLTGDLAISTSLNQQSQQQSQQQSAQSSAEGSGSRSSDDNAGTSENNSGSFSGGAEDGTEPTTGLLANTNVNSFDPTGLGSELGGGELDGSDQSFFLVEIELASLDQNIIDTAISSVIDAMLQKQNEAEDNFKEDTSDEGQLTAEEEDALVASAQSGDISEDAQAALLGYNPNFRAYQTPQMQDVQFYAPKDIYATQKNYDNPNQRFFNGASDATHREMVRQQYGGQ